VISAGSLSNKVNASIVAAVTVNVNQSLAAITLFIHSTHVNDERPRQSLRAIADKLQPISSYPLTLRL
jgi:hypothetical protein